MFKCSNVSTYYGHYYLSESHPGQYFLKEKSLFYYYYYLKITRCQFSIDLNILISWEMIIYLLKLHIKIDYFLMQYILIRVSFLFTSGSSHLLAYLDSPCFLSFIRKEQILSDNNKIK